MKRLIFSSSLVFMCSGLFAQSDKSTIRGTVTDPTGAVVPKVEIIATEIATNTIARTVFSDGNGNYEIADLKPGTYRLKADAAGFRGFVAENLLLDAAQVRRVDIVFQVGSTAETITVEGGAAVITTESGMLSGTITSQNFKDSPHVNPYPSVYAMLTTVPGIQGSGWQVRVAGQAPLQASQGFDGIENDRYGGNTNNTSFYEEVQVSTANNTADNARLSSFNMTSKRGANQFHGGAYYKHFNSALNARNFFDPGKTPFIQHESHVEASGPIFRDRTFFYASWFRHRMPLGTFKNATVPSLPMRRGDFRQFNLPGQVIQDPLAAADAAGNRTPFPNQIIPANRFNAVSLKTQDTFLPEPNQGDPNVYTSNNFGFVHPFHYDFYKGDWPFLRVDHNITANNTLYVRFLRGRFPYILDRNLPKFIWTRLRDHRQWAISDTHVFSPTMVNTFRLGINPNLARDGDEFEGVRPLQGDEAVAAIGLQGVNRGSYKAQGFPTMNITGIQSLSTVAGGTWASDADWSFEDSLTWNKGKHVWKFGGELRTFESFDGRIPEGTYGTFSFNGSMTRSTIGYADFLLGIPQQATRLDPLVNRTRTTKEAGVFFTDTYKITSRLTLDYGLRYDYYALPTFTDGLMYNWDRATNTVNVSPEGASRIHPLYPRNIRIGNGRVIPEPDKKNIRPRLSAAYRLSDKLVLRGGYGAFTERIDYFQRVLTGGPFQISENYQNVIAPGGGPLFLFPNPYPASLASAGIPSQSITGYPIQTDNGAIHQFNLSVEREWKTIGFRTSYIGSRGTGLNYNVGINKPLPGLIPFAQSRRPYPEFVGVTEARSDGETRYDSLQIQA
ncbi:MAG: carboxypeptidase regulatory-like domain-containing protein, partial [Bryobacteraceae bacterium]